MTYLDSVYDIIRCIIGYIFLMPLSLIYPKKKQIVFFSGSDGKFNGNVKYLYIYAKYLKSKSDKNLFILVEDSETYRNLLKKNEPVIFYPSLKGIRILLSSSIVIVDHNEWFQKYKFFLLFFTKKIQLWHGVGFKKIEMINLSSKIVDFNFIKSFVRVFRIVKGRYPKYDLIVSTSDFYSNEVFSKAFRYKQIIKAGYPRNDHFFDKTKKRPDIFFFNTDLKCLQIIKNQRAQSKKVIIYMPTFRDNGTCPLDQNALDFYRFNQFCIKNNFFLIIKTHPRLALKTKLMNYTNIYTYEANKDIYPLLPLTDALITDYSSIFTDYLLLNKPVFFFCYDLFKYMNEHREIQFDYNIITPGAKCFNQNELENNLFNSLIGNIDDYKKIRGTIKKQSFTHLDGNASKRIWDIINKMY